MQKIIWHVGGLTNLNQGDAVLQSATAKIFRERLNCDVTFVHVDNQKTFFSEYLIDKMNDEASMILIGGGGFIFHRPDDDSQSGWQFNIRTQDISKIKIPIVVYGIGNNKFPHDTNIFPNSMWENIQEVIDRSVAFSTRNHGTRESMNNAGIDVSKVDVVPDSAMFADSYLFNHPCLDFDSDRLKIGLNIATDRWDHRFLNNDSFQIIDSLLEACKNISKHYGAKIYLIEHLIDNHMNKNAKKLIRSIAKNKMGEDLCVLFEEAKRELYPAFGYTSGLFVDVYRQMHLTIGMRGHANIIPFGQNTPCIGVGEHNKVRWFLEDISSNLYIPFESGSDCNKKDLKDAVSNVITNMNSIKQDMLKTKARLCNTKDEFIDKTLGQIK